MKSLEAQYNEKKRAIYKVCMARGGQQFIWQEYWRQVEELRREMIPLFKVANAEYPWSAHHGSAFKGIA